jgi:ribosomal protein S18 acetylase RimI-like enzyme
MIEIFEVTKSNESTLKLVNRLLPQLSKSAPPLTSGKLEDIVQSTHVHLYIAQEGAEVLGMLSLVVFPIPTGIRAWVEDVVVDELARGKGVGRALSEYAVQAASEKGALTVDLTSRPSRVAANQLYQKVGFQLRETNVYRFQHEL